MTSIRFESLIEAHHQEIYRYLWRMCLSYGDAAPASQADDLTQETFLRAYRAFDRLRPDSNPRAWLYKIATNLAHSELGRRSRRSSLEVQASEPQTDAAWRSPEHGAIRRERAAQLRTALGALPFKQRSAVTLRYLEGLSYAEIGGVIDCTEDSARANVYQGLQRLRQLLPKEMD